MKGERGELLIGLAVLIGTLIPAILLATAVDVGDDVATRFVLYGAAVGAAGVIWSKLVRPVIRACNVIFGLDERVERVEHRQIRIEHHLGLAPEADEA